MAHETKTTKAAPKAAKKTADTLALPPLVATTADIDRLIRELQNLSETQLQNDLRKADSAGLPQTSQLLEAAAHLNKLNLAQAKDRQALLDFLEAVKKQALLLHFSFSTDPPTQFIEKLMVWLRREIHPRLLISVGLQPTIGAGCMIRSTNRYFDFTLRSHFANHKELMVQGLAGTQPEAAPAQLPVEAMP